MTQEQRISLNPEPPVQGQEVAITYDFSGLALEETRLRVTFSPGGTPVIYHVTVGDPSVGVPVPGDATSVLIEDLDGPSSDKASAVEPASVPA